MYENGRRINGHQKKRLHKRKMKDRYAKKWYYGETEASWKELVLKYEDEPRTKWGHPLDYWKDYSRSDLRTEAKNRTNRSIRREFSNNKDQITLEEDFPVIKKGKYRRYYDYAWNVW